MTDDDGVIVNVRYIRSGAETPSSPSALAMITRMAATSAGRACVTARSAEMIPIGEGFLWRLAELVAWLEWGVEVVKVRCASPLGARVAR